MKLVNSLFLVFALIFAAGCASTSTSSSTAADEAPVMEDNSARVQTSDTTADTGTGYLMDRYKSGQIPGYRD